MSSANRLKIIFSVLALLAVSLAWVGLRPKPVGAAAAQPHERYQCPMHPQIVQNHPGDCPICHMHLERVDDGPGQGRIIRYRNPMDPRIFSDHAMKDSMGMEYIPVYEEAAGGPGAVPGKAGFSLSQERQQLIGVRTAVAEIAPLVLTVRMPGRGLGAGRVQAQLLQIDAGSLKPGMKARVLGPLGASVEATVLSIDTVLDSPTYSFGVLLGVRGPAPWLKAGLFCQVLVAAGLGSHLAIPQEAVLDTGQRQVAFVTDGRGHFEPRQVVLGQVGDDAVEVKQGLKAGEEVVTSANFLIDSESRFQAALKDFGGAGHD